MENTWLTTNQAAEMSGYQTERIRELLRAGKVIGQKFSTVWMVNQQSLLSYLEKMENMGKRRGPKPKNN